MTRSHYPSLAHWGAFTAVVEAGRVIDCVPFGADPAPSAMLDSIAEMLHSPLRIQRPSVPKGWLSGNRHREREE